MNLDEKPRAWDLSCLLHVGSTEWYSSTSVVKGLSEKPEAGEEMSRKELKFLVYGFLLISCGALRKLCTFPEPLFVNL